MEELAKGSKVEKCLAIAWHEAGHALMAHLVGMHIESISLAENCEEGGTLVSGCPKGTTQSEVHRALVVKTIAGPIAQFILEKGHPEDQGQILLSVQEILDTEAANDKILVENLSRVLVPGPQYKSAPVRSEIILETYAILAQPKSLAVLTKLANALLAASPRTLSGSEAQEVIQEGFGSNAQ